MIRVITIAILFHFSVLPTSIFQFSGWKKKEKMPSFLVLCLATNYMSAALVFHICDSVVNYELATSMMHLANS